MAQKGTKCPNAYGQIWTRVEGTAISKDFATEERHGHHE